MNIILMLIGVVIVYNILRVAYRDNWSRNLSVDVTFSSNTATKGDTIKMVETVTNAKRMPLPCVNIKFSIDKNLVFGQEDNNSRITDKTYRNDVFSLLSNQRVTRKIDVLCARRGVGITTVQNNGKNVYKIVASGEGFEMNRRESFRLFLGLGAVVQIGSNKKAVNVILKDISENGFSFVEIEDIDAENLPVRLVFNDMKTGISLIGNIVRKVTVGEKKIIYGCTLTSCNIDVARYINEKQRQFLAASRSSRSSGESNKEALKRSLREPTQYESALKAAQANQDSKKQGKRKKG